MTAIAQSFYTYLTADAGIAAIAGERIYPHVIPQADLSRPAITFGQNGDRYLNHLNGRSDLREAEFEVNSFSTTYLAARNLADAVDTALTGFRGTFGSHTAEFIDKTSDFDAGFDDDTGLYQVTQIFMVAYY